MESNHIVAVIGGAVSGAEAAALFSRNGVTTVVFEQNRLPYGKLEDGLPKWHIKLRNKEELSIDSKLDHPLIHYVPLCRLGQEIDFNDLASNWGFSAIILATGAWRDRALPIEGIDAFIGNGFYYQNPFIHWFNHCHEPGFHSSAHKIEDGAIVIGGGLASLDVVKVIMIETVRDALEKRGIASGLFSLERSISDELKKQNLSLHDLGLKGCTLFYRRRIADMPLSPLPDDTPEQVVKAGMVREKILRNFQEKYLFHVAECHLATDKIVEGDRLAGLVFNKTEKRDGKFIPVPGSETDVRSPLLISSIGSMPVSVPGIPSHQHTFKINDLNNCLVEGFKNVFAVGNAVTGRGNILESLKHSQKITRLILPDFVIPSPPSLLCTTSNILLKIKQLQNNAGYSGYRDWISRHLPVRVEDLPQQAK